MSGLTEPLKWSTLLQDAVAGAYAAALSASDSALGRGLRGRAMSARLS